MISHKIFLSAAIVWLALCSTTKETLARLGTVDHRHLSEVPIALIDQKIDEITTRLSDAIQDIVELNAPGSEIDIEQTLSGKLDRVLSLKAELEVYRKSELKRISDEGAALIANADGEATGKNAAQTLEEKIEDLISQRNHLDNTILLLDDLVDDVEVLTDSSVAIIERLVEQTEAVDNAQETATVPQLKEALLSVQGLIDDEIPGAQQSLHDAEILDSQFAKDRTTLLAKSIEVASKLFDLDPNA